jgi:site-specific DNA-methyltransferase (adenine-specific)
MIESNIVYNEDCLATMKRMDDNSIDMVVTSPPYGSLRSYNGFSFDFENISKELYRVLKPGGVLFWVVGVETVKGSRSLETQKQAIYFVENCGFTFYDHLIYEKSSFSFPIKNKYYPVWENIYVMSKGKIATFNPITDREVKYTQSRGKATQRQVGGELLDTGRGIIKYNKTSRRFNIWRYSTGYGNSTRDKEAYEHPAIYPEKLAQDAILSWSNPQDVIYDPFMGSGTTAKSCLLLDRNYIGSEISKKYIDIIEKRLSKTQKVLL